MNDQAIRFRLGIFVLGAFILLGVLVVLFGGFPDYFRSTDDYTIIFDSAPGVSPGTPVRRSGVRIGEVSRLDLNNDTGKVEVVIHVEAGRSLRRQDQAMLTQGLLGGDSTIDFVTRPPEDKLAGVIEPGSTIEGKVQADAGSVVGPAKSTMEKFNELTPLMKKTLEQYERIGANTNATMPEMRKKLDEATVQFKAAAENWRAAGKKLDELLGDNRSKIDSSIDSLNKMFSDKNQKNFTDALEGAKKFGEMSKSMEGVASDARDMFRAGRRTFESFDDTRQRANEAIDLLKKTLKPFSERSDTMAKNFDESADKLNKLLTDMRDLLQAFARSEGTVQKLIVDPSLYDNLNATACMITRIIPRLDRILRDMEIFADKVARHPESLGLGGVIRPGSGLKDAPTVLPWRGAH